MILVEYSKCSTCQKAKHWLEDHGQQFELRSITEDTPTFDELKQWHLISEQPIRALFNTSGNSYKSRGLKDTLDQLSDDEALKLLSTDGMLIKRPILVNKKHVVFGFKIEKWEKMINE